MALDVRPVAPYIGVRIEITSGLYLSGMPIVAP